MAVAQLSANTDDVVLRMRRISKAFAGQPALIDVDFETRAGEVHVLAGENGAGKSTLIRILAGVHGEYKGQVELEGRPVRFRTTHEAARHGVAVIHQELSLIPSMTVADNVFLGRERSTRLGLVRFRSQGSACRDQLATLGIEAEPERRVEELSLSEQQGVEIAKALSADARIIVMDEPTSALTAAEVDRLFAIVAGLKARGCAIVFISHKLDEIYRIGDRITVLRDGRLVGTRAAAQLPRAELIRWMVGREVADQGPARTVAAGQERLVAEELTVPDRSGRPRPAVNRISFEVRRGEILGFAGLAGSGASELFWGLFGAFGRVPKGRVTLDGETYQPRSPRHAVRSGLALVANDRKATGLVRDMSITRNVTLPSLERFSPHLWLQRDRERAHAEQLRLQLGVRATSLDQPAGSLSGGNQQKVVLAKWLATQPRVLLLDEPTRGIDVGAKEEIYRLMDGCRNRGMAILLITSELPELLALADRIIVMHEGSVAARLDRSEATQEAVLEAAMGQVAGVS